MPVEVYPIVAVSVLAVGGATWYLTRLARSPDVIWDKKVCAFFTYDRTTLLPGTTLSQALNTSCGTLRYVQLDSDNTGRL